MSNVRAEQNGDQQYEKPPVRPDEGITADEILPSPGEDSLDFDGSTDSDFEADTPQSEVVPETSHLPAAEKRQHDSTGVPAEKVPPTKTRATAFLESIPKISTLTDTSADWIVPGLIVKGGFHIFTGEPGSMKSMVALFLAAQISSGKEVFGKTTSAYTVVYLDKENPASLIQQRFSLVNIADEKNLFYLGTWWLEHLDSDVLLEIAKQYQPIFIFDSLVRFHKQDENSATEMKTVTAGLRRLCSAGATVIALHHRGKGGLEGHSPYRGTSEIAAACDLGFCIEKEGDTLTIKCFKNRFDQKMS